MQPEIEKLLTDIERAVGLLTQFVAGKAFDDYLKDPLLKSGVERQLEIIGEAVSQLAKLKPDIAAGITDYRKIIAFRNILIHGYAQLDDRLVWEIVKTRLLILSQDVANLRGPAPP